jgi:hypothetical protein
MTASGVPLPLKFEVGPSAIFRQSLAALVPTLSQTLPAEVLTHK